MAEGRSLLSPSILCEVAGQASLNQMCPRFHLGLPKLQNRKTTHFHSWFVFCSVTVCGGNANEDVSQPVLIRCFSRTLPLFAADAPWHRGWVRPENKGGTVKSEDFSDTCP